MAYWGDFGTGLTNQFYLLASDKNQKIYK